MALGMVRSVLDRSLRYATERVQFGQPIANFQAVQFMLADMEARRFALEAMLYCVMAMEEKGERSSHESALAKLWSGQMAVRSAMDAIQIHGGYGYMKEYEVERVLRDAKLLEIGGGTNEIQRLVIARHLLKRVEKAPAEKPRAPSCGEVFRNLERAFRPEKAEGFSGWIQFDISGDGGGSWSIAVTDGSCRCRAITAESMVGSGRKAEAVGETAGVAAGRIGGEAGSEAEVALATVTTDAETFVGVITRKINPQGAFMSGRLRVQGDVASVVRLMGFFGKVE
jgi:hypothetical protein